jgi:hypothetical protein
VSQDLNFMFQESNEGGRVVISLTQGKSVQFSMEVVFLLHVVRFAPFLSSLDLSYLLFPVLFCG